MDTRQPWIAGLIRGFLIAVIGAAITFIGSITVADVPGWMFAFVPVLLFGLRELEALVADQFKTS